MSLCRPGELRDDEGTLLHGNCHPHMANGGVIVCGQTGQYPHIEHRPYPTRIRNPLLILVVVPTSSSNLPSFPTCVHASRYPSRSYLVSGMIPFIVQPLGLLVPFPLCLHLDSHRHCWGKDRTMIRVVSRTNRGATEEAVGHRRHSC